MGFLKQKELEYEAKGFKMPEEKYVCSNHIDDACIEKFILLNADWGYCDYCQSNHRRKVVPFESLVEFMNAGIGEFYGDANQQGMGWDSAEGGWVGTTYSTNELLCDVIGLEIDSDDLLSDLEYCYEDYAWCEQSPYADRESDELAYSWKEFKNVVKHKARYVFSQSPRFTTGLYKTMVHEILDDISRRVEQLNLFTELPVNSRLIRGQQHEKFEKILTAKRLSSPPLEFAKHANRMSPAGISMFYCAFDARTSEVETVNTEDTLRTHFTYGVFTNKEPLFVLDLSKLPSLPSIFDEKMRDWYYSILFLKAFINDLSARVEKDGREHIEYVPTQIVTEYFRYIFEHSSFKILDGIIYPSSRRKGNNACVLFFDHETSLQKLNLDPKNIKRKKVRME